MSENDGEKDLVLGNKQLLGIFFVAVLLCGVFFAMGYVVGGNSAKAGAAASVGATDGSSASTTEGKREEPQAPSTADSGATAASGDTGNLPGAEPRMADNPAAAGSQPVAAAVPEPAAPKVTQAAPAPDAAPKAVAAAAHDAGAMAISTPVAGASYIQVAALARPAADELVTTLRKRELPAILATSSKPDFFRVLVGPYRSSLSLADAKSKLKGLGFDSLIVHKQ